MQYLFTTEQTRKAEMRQARSSACFAARQEGDRKAPKRERNKEKRAFPLLFFYPEKPYTPYIRAVILLINIRLPMNGLCSKPFISYTEAYIVAGCDGNAQKRHGRSGRSKEGLEHKPFMDKTLSDKRLKGCMKGMEGFRGK